MRKTVDRQDPPMATAGGVGAGLVAGPVGLAALADQWVTVYVRPGARKEPDGKGHAVVPSNVAVKTGSHIRLQVINYDTDAHTFTAPGFGLTLRVTPGTHAGGHTTPAITTTTFTAAKPGAYRWFCALHCDDLSHGAEETYMTGFIVAT